MKNELIQALGTLFREAKTNTLDVKDAYKVLKWKSEFLKASQAIEDRRQELVKETFTDEEQKILSDDKATKSKELSEKVNNFNKLYFELMADESSVAIKTISYESWHSFIKENDIKLGYIECELEGILFESLPSDDENK